MKKFSLLLLVFLPQLVDAQSIADKLRQAYDKLAADPQMKHALIGLHVVDLKSGTTIFSQNGETGMAPASTQKVLTAIAAYELLGKDFRFNTEIFHNGKPDQTGKLNGNLFVKPGGDPTLGSWRWPSTSEKQIYSDWATAIEAAGIRNFAPESRLYLLTENSGPHFPDGWIWQDIGNYYGAGHGAFNWRENQFDIRFDPGPRVGSPVKVNGLRPDYTNIQIDARALKTGAAGSGDQAYVYLMPLDASSMFVRGTIPLGEKAFTIRAAHPRPETFFAAYLKENEGLFRFPALSFEAGNMPEPSSLQKLYTHQSPPLDTINYWFLRLSINLYGEALLSAIHGKLANKNASGLALVKDFFNEKGIPAASVGILDGSGLSPQNRISTKALVSALQYAYTRSWYPSFYHALPTINGMKMKSGTILGARGYAGYQLSNDGKEYAFAILVNNFEGSPAATSRKLFELLNLLK